MGNFQYISMGQLLYDGNYSDWNQLTIRMVNGETVAANLSPSPSPTVPELSWLAIVPLLLSVLSVAVIIRHRKTPNSR